MSTVLDFLQGANHLSFDLLIGPAVGVFITKVAYPALLVTWQHWRHPC